MKNKSRQISYLLRHNPEDLEMDKQGWVSTHALLAKVGLTIEELEDIIENNDKKRFGFNEDKTMIRAHQGHGAKLGLKITFNEVQFPGTYYHGTQMTNMNIIKKHGLKPMKRSHVHLSKDVETAVNVGGRKGDTIIVFEVDGNQMKRDGYKIYESENGVILVDEVSPKYLKIKE